MRTTGAYLFYVADHPGQSKHLHYEVYDQDGARIPTHDLAVGQTVVSSWVHVLFLKDGRILAAIPLILRAYFEDRARLNQCLALLRAGDAGAVIRRVKGRKVGGELWLAWP